MIQYRIGIQTWGANGDIRPAIALANDLQKAGHTVTLVVASIDNQSYAEICRKLAIHYLQIPARIEMDMQAFAERTNGKFLPHWLGELMDEAFFPYEHEIYRASRQLAAENDCLIGHHLLYPLKLAARQWQKPFYSITFCPAGFPVPKQPPFRFPDYGERYYRLEWRLFYLFFNWVLKKKLTRLWLDQGQAQVDNVLTDLLISDELNLIVSDPLFCPDQSQWPPVNRVCGFLQLDEDAQHWQMPEGLERFLQQGEPPVYMTFGSMQQTLPERNMELLIGAARQAGCRAIIQTSTAQYPADSQQAQIYFVGKHPHRPVFERCAAIVHHGGAGTAHTATYCGRPSVVVPFMDEQLYWARRLQKLGIAVKPLAIHKISIVELASRIRNVLDSPAMHEKAQTYGKLMQKRQGSREAVRLIEEHLRFSVVPNASADCFSDGGLSDNHG
ncbi:MAG: glycosyltransferase [Gammaproteobacteria bacterium]